MLYVAKAKEICRKIRHFVVYAYEIYSLPRKHTFFSRKKQAKKHGDFLLRAEINS